MSDTSEILITDRPVFSWLFALLWLTIGGGMAYSQGIRGGLPVAGMLIVPLLVVLLSPVVEVRGDHQRRLLIVRRRYLWGGQSRILPLDHITEARVARRFNLGSDAAYRLEIVTREGEIIPVRRACARRPDRLRQQARLLGAFRSRGIEHPDDAPPADPFNMNSP